ncbi:transposase family protein [Planctomycetales bacterium ZRK34]|nr:transposase family protein [Planctomycetales bacterium ZRK34]
MQAEGNEAPKPVKQGGRPVISDTIRELVIRIARESGVGYSNILGELKKLGISISRTSIHNILIAEGLYPDPRRVTGTWENFIKRHAKTLWATDFATKKVLALGGFVDYFILFFIHIETRQVIVCPVTAHPDTEWMKQQVRNFFIEWAALGLSITHLLHDWDTKYMRAFDAIFESEGVTVHKVGLLASNLNAYAERWVQSLKHECLNHFIVFGERHLQRLVNEYVDYYNVLRPHQGVGNVVLDPDAPPCRWRTTANRLHPRIFSEDSSSTTTATRRESAIDNLNSSNRSVVAVRCRWNWTGSSRSNEIGCANLDFSKSYGLDLIMRQLF